MTRVSLVGCSGDVGGWDVGVKMGLGAGDGVGAWVGAGVGRGDFVSVVISGCRLGVGFSASLQAANAHRPTMATAASTM